VGRAGTKPSKCSPLKDEMGRDASGKSVRMDGWRA